MEKKEKILFVDDEEAFLEIAEEYFRQKGYQVVTAKNGLEAVKILEKEKIDCCFTDINMPKMDGLELAEYIRKSDNTIPVIILTAYPSLDISIKTIQNGVVDFLIKPIDFYQIELCIKRILRERNLFVENILLKKEVESKSRLEKLNQELIYKIKELQTLNRIMSDFATIRTSSDMFNKVVDIAKEITQADEIVFYIINEETKKPIEVAMSFANQQKPDLNNRKDSVIAEKHAKDSEAQKAYEQLISSIVSDKLPLLISTNQGIHGLPLDIASFMIVPLTIRGKVFGVLTAFITTGDYRFTEKDLYYLSFMTQNTANSTENLILYENIYENLFSTLYAFVRALEARDPYTQQHSNRVTEVSISIAKAMHCTSEQLDIINFSGHLHDIGKIGIRDDILLKPGKLTVQEFEKVKEHPIIGEKIVEKLGLWDQERRIIRHHHERFDGRGYPDGLTKGEIPFLARILAVADAYDAMASDRAYRKKMNPDKILNIINNEAGRQFDPDVVSVFIRLYQENKIPKLI